MLKLNITHQQILLKKCITIMNRFILLISKENKYEKGM